MPSSDPGAQPKTGTVGAPGSGRAPGQPLVLRFAAGHALRGHPPRRRWSGAGRRGSQSSQPRFRRREARVRCCPGLVSSALTTAPSAFACLEEDGLLLAVALAAALAMLALASVAAWEALSATGWVPGIL